MRPVVQTKIVCTKKSISTLKVIGGVKMSVCHSGVTLKMMSQLKLFKDKYLHNTETLNSSEVCLQGAPQGFRARAQLKLNFPVKSSYTGASTPVLRGPESSWVFCPPRWKSAFTPAGLSRTPPRCIMSPPASIMFSIIRHV